MNVRDRVPSAAEVARTVVAGASSARLRIGEHDHPDPVTVRSSSDGRLKILAESWSPLADLLDSCPVATLTIAAAAPFGALTISGAIGRSAESISPVFSVALLTMNFAGPCRVPVTLASYFAATPDPLAPHAASMLDHLERGHSAGLLDCLQAHGMTEARAVVPRAVDRYGLELGVITTSGVATARLAFPGGPVSSVREVAAHLRVVLICAAKRRATD